MTRNLQQQIFPVFAVLFAAMLAFPAHAQTISEDQRLNFGEWLITGNSNPAHNITVAANGTYSASPGLIMLSPPQPGVYQVTGLPSLANVNGVNVVMTDPLGGPGGQTFTMDNFDVVCPNAGFGGDTTITLGARARLSGTNVTYGDGLYTGELTLEIDY